MGLDIYIDSTILGEIPQEYNCYIEDGISGSWLRTYVGFGNLSNGCGAMHITDYLEKYFPTWEQVEVYLQQKYSDGYIVWTEQEHESFKKALQYFSDNDDRSYIMFDC
jgi:hypothetical protein